VWKKIVLVVLRLCVTVWINMVFLLLIKHLLLVIREIISLDGKDRADVLKMLLQLYSLIENA